MTNHHDSASPTAGRHQDAHSELVVLDQMVRRLIEVGADALADDQRHGECWGLWADWCWRTGRDALGATAHDVTAWLTDDAPTRDTDTVTAVLDAVATVHGDAGLDDPTRGLS